MKKSAWQILIVDDHPVVRQGLRQLFEGEGNLSVCAEAGSAAECLSLLAKTEPDLVLVDLSLDGTDGLELVKEIRQFNSFLPILIFSMHDETLYAERALSAGANGYVMKQARPDVLLKGIRQVLGNEVFLSPEMTGRLLRKISGHHAADSNTALLSVNLLSDRELEVFSLIGHGLSTHRIAEKLHLSEKTIETYRLRIKEKLHIEETTELMHRAVHWVEAETGAP